ncbi:MAG: hypothetical protein U0869_18850 [Chloroflexota bacterium]
MSSIAASFQDPISARRVARRLIARLRIPPAYVKVATLGAAGEADHDAPLVAAYVPDEVVETATEIIAEGGGSVLLVARPEPPPVDRTRIGA